MLERLNRNARSAKLHIKRKHGLPPAVCSFSPPRSLRLYEGNSVTMPDHVLIDLKRVSLKSAHPPNPSARTLAAGEH